MMIVSTAKHAKMKGQEGQHLVYVDRLETAPWNRPEYTARARLNGVGSILIIAAITFSLGEEFKGRIGLHSLPNANAFYLKCGMTDLGPDRKYDNLHYFEMTPEQAKDFREGKEKS